MRKGILIYSVLFILFLVFVGPYFIQNITWLLNPESSLYLFQNRWDLVLFYIIIFSMFSFFLIYHPLKKGTWKKSTSIYIAFIIALFTEMFGIPLTAYFLSSFVSIPQNSPVIAFSFDFFGVNYDLLLTSLIAGIFSITGMIFIILGWKKIYKSKGLVTDGIYKIVRHPQYFGILLIVTAWLFAWPTLITIIMWPILVFSYYKLSKYEEIYLEKKFGKKYLDYKNKVSMLLPYF
ncbi:MAG: methyltransferase family protein [Candidatus Aenigmatarchaeota archaeon]